MSFSIGNFFFKHRDKLPVPLVILMLKCSKPTKIGWLIGLPLVFAGEMLRLWGLRHIGPSTRTREVSAEKLVTSGPYAHCRNPLYLANLLKVTGLTIIAGNIYFSILTLVFYLVEFIFMIDFEENFLANKFPEQHKAYTKLVPIFFPTIKPCKQLDAKPSFSFIEALKSEKRTMTSTSLILLLLAACKLRTRQVA